MGKIRLNRRVHLRAIEKERAENQARWREWRMKSDRTTDRMTDAQSRSHVPFPVQNPGATLALGSHGSGRGDGQGRIVHASPANPDLHLTATFNKPLAAPMGKTECKSSEPNSARAGGVEQNLAMADSKSGATG